MTLSLSKSGILNCDNCNEAACELRAFLGSYSIDWAYELAAQSRPHRLEAHLRQAGATGENIAEKLFERGIIRREEGCLAAVGSALHDLGHVIPQLHDGLTAEVIAVESRHTHRLEFWLRLKGQLKLASTIRHSAPLVVLDAFQGKLSIAQLIVALADTTTTSDGQPTSIQRRFQEVDARHKHLVGWQPDLQERYMELLEVFEKWVDDARSRFGDTVEPGSRQKTLVFVERCDGRYTPPVGAFKESNTVFHLCTTSVAGTWNATSISGGYLRSTDRPEVAPFTAHHLPVLDLSACTELIAGQHYAAGMVVTSWLSLLESQQLPECLCRVLLIRGLRLGRAHQTYIERLKRARSLGLIDQIVVVGPALRDWLERNGVGSRLIPNGCEAAHFSPVGRLRQRQVLFVGAPIREKGIRLLLGAASSLERLGVRLVVAGTPEIYGTSVEAGAGLNGISSNVSWRGYVSHGDLPALYEESLATVIPTDPEKLFEGFSKVALESLRMGTPLFASRCGNLPHWIDEGSTGWLIEPYDSAVLVNLIRSNLAALERGAFSAACRDKSAGYTWESTAWQLDRLYDELQLVRHRAEVSSKPPPERLLDLVGRLYPNLLPRSHPPLPERSQSHRGTILALEPHPDDIAFGCCLELLEYWAAGFEITVISAFSGASVSMFRYSDKLPVSASDLRTIRESENRLALTAYLPFRLQQLGLPTAAGRGYARAFAKPLVTDAARLTVQDAVRSLGEDPVMLFAPAGFGGHADHLLLREIGLSAFNTKTILYEEAPYVREDSETAEALTQQGWIRKTGGRSGSSFDIKVAVVSHYLSQLPVRSKAELVRYIEGWTPQNPTYLEAFWTLPNPS